MNAGNGSFRRTRPPLRNLREDASSPFALARPEQRKDASPELFAQVVKPVPPGWGVKVRKTEGAGTVDREAVQSQQEATEVASGGLAEAGMSRRAVQLAVTDAGDPVAPDEFEARDRNRQRRRDIGQKRDLALHPPLDFGPPRKAEYPRVIDLQDEAVPAVLDDADVTELELGEMRPELVDGLTSVRSGMGQSTTANSRHSSGMPLSASARGRRSGGPSLRRGLSPCSKRRSRLGQPR